jgi:hypothetical protein
VVGEKFSHSVCEEGSEDWTGHVERNWMRGI